MNGFKVIFLTLLLSSKLLYSVFWQINFIINQKEITRLECENKDKPLMKCNGKCYLAKQLQKVEDEITSKKSKQEQSKNTLKLTEGSIFVEPRKITYSCDYSTQFESINIDSYQQSLLVGVITSIFKPPCLT